MSTSKNGDILYRCRLCNEVFVACHSGDWHASLVWAAIGMDLNTNVTQHPQAPTLRTIHFCKSGRRGIADLVGAEPEDVLINGDPTAPQPEGVIEA